ncbi:class I SAM-dependent methyltransferase [Streptomyces sp. NPDC093252]|uniref:SAM-dependent methyltransferase n=1 Tax=Streptomyces sp. NPDC093252 TaxID=3154980 RepID=UPI0034188E83
MTALPDSPPSNAHYDQAPEIFEAFLDRRMKYTSGIFSQGDESLDTAQLTKLRTVAGLLGLTGGERVLDIGSGWGSMVCHLAGLGCEVTGVTPAPAQAAYIRARAAREGVADRVTLAESSIYATDLGGARFDAVTLVGVAEALPDLDAVLRLVARHLRPGGRVYLSAACFRSREHFTEYTDRPASRHVAETIFGGGSLRPLSELVACCEDARLSVIGCHDLTEHYRRTIDHWIARVSAARDTIDALRPGYSDELVRYLRTSNAGWGHTTRYYGLVAARSRDGVAIPVG